ncbi:hypothetical protein [Hamadaea tsunoensis]|uniref:hypothetical protein n=1 Tax=Hamadaea tsunoensis TaxID=53368 RepID=UPI0012FB0F6B|nr:hypothetical protein [Hamadaea tsunoensis]
MTRRPAATTPRTTEPKGMPLAGALGNRRVATAVRCLVGMVVMLGGTGPVTDVPS